MSPESWQQRNTEEQKPVLEKKEESAADFETKLSPEQMEQIMAKVQDIHKDGVAFSLIRPDKLENILSDGLLGSYEESMWLQDKEVNKNDWARKTREEKNSNVFFNITGRMADVDEDFPIRNSEWFDHALEKKRIYTEADFYGTPEHRKALSEEKNASRKTTHHVAIAVMFDISKYSEEEPIFEFKKQGQKFHNKTYRPFMYMVPTSKYQGFKEIDYYDKKYSDTVERIKENYPHSDRDGKMRGEKIMPSSLHGFALSHRVPPKLFTGMVINFSKVNESDEVVELNSYGEYMERVSPYIKTMLKNSKLNNLMPIYHASGELIWPKKMSYDEVKVFVTERDAKKEDKSE